MLPPILISLGLACIVIGSALWYRQTTALALKIEDERAAQAGLSAQLAAKSQAEVDQAKMIVMLRDHLHDLITAYDRAAADRAAAAQAAMPDPYAKMEDLLRNPPDRR